MPTFRMRRAAGMIAAVALLAALIPAVPAYAGGGLFVTINVVGAASSPPPTVTATLHNFEGEAVASVSGIGNGAILLFPDEPAGRYWLSAHATSGTTVFAREFLGGVYWGDESIPVEIIENAAFPAPQPFTLEAAGTITGTVDVPASATDEASLEAYRWDGEKYRYLASTGTSAVGEFSLNGLPAGDYRVRTVSDDRDVQPEWWEDATSQAGADTLTVATNSTQQILPVLGATRDFDFGRLQGANRFETNVLVSQALFPPSAGPYSVPVLYVANGRNYPDALSAGPAASHLGGGLLLVDATSIPSVVAAEISRLSPQKIVIAGGTSLVSAGVATQLAGFAPVVERVAGSTRYETSRLIVSGAFGCSEAPCLDTVFIANGGNFPDALAAGPAAAVRDAPVLLVRGTSSAIDAATSDALDALEPLTAVVLGSTASVTPGIANDLNAKGIHVERYAGANRYETAALLNAATFDGATERAYVATGAGFADALAGGPLAAAYGAPLILTPKDCGTTANYNLIYAVGILEIVYLGGLSSVGDVVLGPNCGP